MTQSLAVLLSVAMVCLTAAWCWRLFVASRGGPAANTELGNKTVVLIIMILGAAVVAMAVYFMRDIITFAAESLPLDSESQEAISGFLHNISVALQLGVVMTYLVVVTQSVTRLLQPEPPDVAEAIRSNVKVMMEENRELMRTWTHETLTYLERRDRELFKLMKSD